MLKFLRNIRNLKAWENKILLLNLGYKNRNRFFDCFNLRKWRVKIVYIKGVSISIVYTKHIYFKIELQKTEQIKAQTKDRTILKCYSFDTVSSSLPRSHKFLHTFRGGDQNWMLGIAIFELLRPGKLLNLWVKNCLLSKIWDICGG